MATNWITVKGTLAWAQVYEPDEYAGDKRWKVSFYPFDGSEWEKLRKAGVQLEAFADKVGKEFVTLRRPVKRIYDDEVTFFTPPVISGAASVSYVNAATKEPVRSHKKADNVVIEQVGERVLLGNGTVVLANIAVYDTFKGKGHRLEGLKVLDLVHYERPDEGESGPVAEEPPVPETAKAAKPATKKKDDMNDEIPW